MVTRPSCTWLGEMLQTKSMRPYFHATSILRRSDIKSSLHSKEARERMHSFQIGRTGDDAWSNFLPPIQGGMFRSYNEDGGNNGYDDDDDDDGIIGTDSQSVSDTSSKPSSSIFNTPIDVERLKERRVRDTVSDATSLSSSNSVDSVETKKKPKLSHLDTITQRAIDLDLANYPALDSATQQDIIARYRKLDERIREQGLYQCNYWAYAVEVSRYLFLLGLSLLFLKWSWYGTSGAFLGLCWHQLVFTAHDAGHMGITHNFHVDTIIGIVIADFIGGLSLGWWKKSHNVHHIMTNSPEHDPDIEHMPFFAISHRFFDSLFSTYHDRVMAYDQFAKIMIQYQHYLYYPILLFGRFNLYVQSWIFLSLGLGPKKGPAWWHRWLEIAGQVFFWTWFGYGIVYKSIPTASGRFAFVMISHMVTAPLHVQITLSHFAMSTADLGVHESFPQKMLRTTMDVDCPDWLDWFHGGLQFQAVHHLYPRIPRHNLRRTQKLVQQFCEEARIPYALYGFVRGNKEVIGRLGEVGKQAAILAQCQKILAEGGFGHH